MSCTIALVCHVSSYLLFWQAIPDLPFEVLDAWVMILQSIFRCFWTPKALKKSLVRLFNFQSMWFKMYDTVKKPVADFIGPIVFMGLITTLRFYVPVISLGSARHPMVRDATTDTWTGMDNPSYRTDLDLTTTATFVINFVTPIAIFLINLAIQRKRKDIEVAFQGLLWTGDFAAFIVVALKVFVYVPRPTFWMVCAPVQNRIDRIWSLIPKHERTIPMFVSVSVCRGMQVPDTARMREIKLLVTAFPSGTVMSAFVVATYMALYLNSKMKPFSATGSTASIWKCLAILGPLLGAVVETGILIEQGTHSRNVALVSGVMGMAFAMIGYRCRFCSLFDDETNHLSHKRYLRSKAKPIIPLHKHRHPDLFPPNR
ncbi:MAG: hypothetical protein Q9166_003594 [cf. Caloplaca sp. 2 TL-2023]